MALDFNNTIHYTPDILNCSSFSTVPFNVKNIKKSELVWINYRYFYEMGINLSKSEILTQIKKDLLHTFSVMAESMTDLKQYLGKESHVFYADRYGGSGGAIHGGSGRCGINGGFNAKGIGRTPLVSPSADWWHSTGLMWLNEGIREAIYSEIAYSELPYGAIPIVAIIDTGIDVKVKQSGETERCGIVVRPNFLRPAHFERSIYFGTSGTKDSDQYKDAKSVENYVLKQQIIYEGKSLTENYLLPMFNKFAKQIGRQRAIRIWQGRFLTSNASCDGAIADFGAFRAVSSWRQAYSNKGDFFGKDAEPLAAGLKSVSFYINNYSKHKTITPSLKTLIPMLEAEISKEFYESCRVGFGVDKHDDNWNKLKEYIEQYYLEQQSLTGDIDKLSESNREWLGTSIIDSSQITKTSKNLLSFYNKISNNNKIIRRNNNIFYWLQPRRDMLKLNARLSTTNIINLIRKETGNSFDIVSSHIEMRILKNRRHWEHLPDNFTIISHVALLGTYGWFGQSLSNNDTVLQLYIPRNKNFCWIFGNMKSVDEIKQTIIFEDSNKICIRFNSADFKLHNNKCKINYGNLNIDVNISIYLRCFSDG